MLTKERYSMFIYFTIFTLQVKKQKQIYLFIILLRLLVFFM